MTKERPAGEDKTPAQLGGEARAKALTAEARRSIAARAAAARWGGKPLNATHRGSFKKEFGIDVDCYVLDDDQKTAVISQRGMSAALGMENTSGTAMPRFVRTKMIAHYVGAELQSKIANPLIFQWSGPGANTIVYGYDVTILIDICKSILSADADDKLTARQGKLVKQAHVIVNASAKAGIKGLVYALAGYDATKEDVISAFKFYVQEEAREYEKEFPDQLYEEWYRLYQIPKPERNKPWKFMHLTLNHVYVPLARSNGKILELTRAQKVRSGERWKRLHQFLSEIGTKALRTHLGRLLGMAEASDTMEQYERLVERKFGKQLTLNVE
jgi:hypothetical protein